MKKAAWVMGLAGTLIISGCGTVSNLTGSWSVVNASNPKDVGAMTIKEGANSVLTATLSMDGGDTVPLSGTITGGNIQLQDNDHPELTITGKAQSSHLNLSVNDSVNPNENEQLVATRTTKSQ